MRYIPNILSRNWLMIQGKRFISSNVSYLWPISKSIASWWHGSFALFFANLRDVPKDWKHFNMFVADQEKSEIGITTQVCMTRYMFVCLVTWLPIFILRQLNRSTKNGVSLQCNFFPLRWVVGQTKYCNTLYQT